MKTAVVLAAGESRRLGRPKQLLKMGGETLIQSAIRKANLSGIDEAVVVTGAFAESVRESIRSEDCRVLHNPDWAEGIGSSIRCAAQHLKAHANPVESVLFLLCDQPFVPSSHLRALVEAITKHPATIAATRYPDGGKGIPACFPAAYLEELASLNGSVGAKKLILEKQSLFLPHDSVAIDIDTEADVRAHLPQAET
ncbi:MAG: nucleotidyltransferase family protein [Planctomycetota bacterium]